MAAEACDQLALIGRFQASGEPEARAQIVSLLGPAVHGVADRVHRRYPQFSQEVLVQEGIAGLLQAARVFDPGRGVSWPAFAGQHVLAQMRVFIRDKGLAWTLDSPSYEETPVRPAAEHTLVIVGPGGVGKSPLDGLVGSDVDRLEPYRLRRGGPKTHKPDPFYANPRLKHDLAETLQSLGDSPMHVDCPIADESVEWFPKGRVLLFTVRGGWQALMLGAISSPAAKLEMYAPVLCGILPIADIRRGLGGIEIVILNPARHPVQERSEWDELRERTRENCLRRGDADDDVEDRVRSIDSEASAWVELLEMAPRIRGCKVTECVGWPFAEHRFRSEDPAELLLEARRRIEASNPALARFLRSEDDIESGRSGTSGGASS